MTCEKMANGIDKVVEDLASGKAVLIYDWHDRENEVDMVFYAGSIDVHKIFTLRTEAGGLICFATSKHVVRELNLPLMTEILDSFSSLKLLKKRPSYGDASPFVMIVNSIDVRTGISDEDRAKTVSKLHEVVSLIHSGKVEEARSYFYSNFYAPGHVPILAADDIRVRRGHTELAVALTKLANILPSVVFAEMLSYGRSMSLDEAKRYAEKRGIAMVTGKEIVEAIESLERR